jgi:hypothetical protein
VGGTVTVFIPTTTVTIERDNGTAPATGTYVEGYGDSIANWTAAATGVPAYLYEDDQRTWDPSSSRQTIRTVTICRLRPTVDLRNRDRVRDERTGAIYQVDTISNEPSVIGLADIRAVTIRIDD